MFQTQLTLRRGPFGGPGTEPGSVIIKCGHVAFNAGDAICRPRRIVVVPTDGTRVMTHTVRDYRRIAVHKIVTSAGGAACAGLVGLELVSSFSTVETELGLGGGDGGGTEADGGGFLWNARS